MTYLSYSGYKSYETCPFQYWHKYVNKTRTPEPENGVNSLYGSTVGTVFEAFYRDKIFKQPNYVQVLKELAEPYLDKAIKEQKGQGRIVDWSDEKSNYKSKQALLKDVYEAIPMGVDTIRNNRFVGPIMEAEMKLDHKFGYHMMGGRADFVIQRVKPHGDLLILDGKGSRHRAKYIDGKPKKEGQSLEGIQLKWYSVLYREKYGRLPDALGYLFWRYGGDEAMEWVPFEEQDIDNLKLEVLSTIDRIDKTSRELSKALSPQAHEELRQELYPAKAGHHCNLCAFADVCEEGRKVKARKRRQAKTLPEGVSELSLGLDD